MIIGLGISTPEITLGENALKPASLKGVKAGQPVSAKVLAMLPDSKAQLLVGGQKVIAETQVPLTPGQEISLKLIREKGQLTFKLLPSSEPLQSSKPVQSSPQQNTGTRGGGTVSSPGGSRAPEITLGKEAVNMAAIKGMTEGQIVRAKVLGMVSGSRAQLLVGGSKLTAETGQSLPPGQEIALKLVQKDLLTFKLVQSPFQQASAVREGPSLARIAEGMLAFEKLGQEPGKVLGGILETLALKSGERDEGFLPRLLKNSGILLEKKIATLMVSGDGAKLDSGMQKLVGEDLRAAILHLASRESGGDGLPVDKSPSSTLTRTLASGLENLQVLNTQALDSQKFILPFPVMSGDQFNFGQIFMDTGKKEEERDGGAGDRVIRLAFLLNMSALGGLRADFSVLKKGVAGRFLLEDQSTCDYMRSLVPVLGNRLAAIGFQMGRVECAVADTGQLSPGALIQSMTVPGEARGLDLII